MIDKPKKFGKGFDGLLQYPLKKLPEAPNNLTSPAIGANKWSTSQPFEPDTETETQFLKELEDLHHVRADIARNQWPTWFNDINNVRSSTTKLFEGLGVYEPKDLVTYVHHDSPRALLEAAIEHCSIRLPMIDHPSHNGKPFVHKHVLTGAAAAGIGYALQAAFETKWFFGVVRPEEYAGYNCTGYLEGCPTHPSFPQGHSTVYGFAWKTIETLFPELKNPDKQHEILRDDVIDSFRLGVHAREYAGVHYLQDGVSGWKLGQKVAVEYWGNNGLDPSGTISNLTDCNSQLM